MASADRMLTVPSAFFCWFNERATPSVITPVTITSATSVAEVEPRTMATFAFSPRVVTTVWLAEGSPR